MKKILCILLIVAVVVPSCFLLLTACDNEATDYAHTIIFYSSQGDTLQKVTAIAIKNFEEKYPGWKVEHITAGGYDDVRDKIVADFQGQQQPDIAYCYADHVAQYLQTSKVIDLNTLINSEATVNDKDGNAVRVGYTQDELADFLPIYFNEGLAKNCGDYATYGYQADSMLTLPFVKSTELLYYNKDALDSLGFEPAKTWDELWAQCDKILTKYPKSTPLGYDSEANWFITMCAQNGWGYTSSSEPHFLFDNEGTTQWLKDISELYNKKYITTQALYGGYTSSLFTKGVLVEKTDEKGNTVMAPEGGGIVYCIGSSGGASYQNPGKAFNYGIAPIPGSVREDGTIDNSAISQGPSLVMLEPGYGVENADEKKNMTFLFLKELLDPVFQASFAMTSGYNPCRLSTYELEAYVEFLDGDTIIARASNVAASMRDRFFSSPAFVGSSMARTQVENVIVYSLQGSKSPEKALRDAVKNCGGN